MLIFLFYFALFMIFYIYLGYPIVISLISFIKHRDVNKRDKLPFVTILIAAYNEKECIEKTLQNKLNLDYPKDKFEIIVISDESDDGTDDIVRKYTAQNVTLLRQKIRAGKTAALNMAIPEAKGRILVFSDANSIYEADALQRLVTNFSDPQVGYVTGKMVYVNSDGSLIGDGCSAYMKYENLLRSLESKVGSIVGVDGGIDAVRKELYQPMTADQLPDFVLPLKVVEQGYRVIYEPEAILKEDTLNDAKDEYRMRVRVTLRALWALYDMRQLLNVKKFTLFAWQLWSHKVLRYLCFIFIMMVYLSNLFLFSNSLFFKATFIVQNVFYLGGAIAPFLKKKGYETRLLYFVRYFLLLNMAAGHACIKFLMRQKQVLWTPRKG